MSKFKVGDRVKHTKGIGVVIGITRGTMPYLVDGIGHHNREACTESDFIAGGRNKSQKCYWCGEDDLSLVAPTKILITHDGRTTLARLYEGNKVVKSAEAKCAPSDTFDFKTGAKLAFERLVGEDKPEPKQGPVKLYCVRDCKVGGARVLTRGKVYEINAEGYIDFDNRKSSFKYKSFDDFKDSNIDRAACLVPLAKRPAKVGEWVYMNRNGYWRGYCYSVGETYKVDSVNPINTNRCYVHRDKDTELFLDISEYLVIDGYQPEPERCKCCGQVMPD